MKLFQTGFFFNQSKICNTLIDNNTTYILLALKSTGNANYTHIFEIKIME